MLGNLTRNVRRIGGFSSLSSRFYGTPSVNFQLLPESEHKKLPEDPLSVPFGTFFSDHMLLYKWTQEGGWSESADLKPYGPISLLPSCNVFHYGQEVFEGMKAYTNVEGKHVLFRPEKNFERMKSSCSRVRLPELPVESGIHVLKELLKVDRRFIPNVDGTSLYIRPTMIATEPCLGVKASSEALFFIITCPVGSYYQGSGGVRIMICDQYSRAAPGGTGEAKAGGNYAASLIGSEAAQQHGCQQALWLDAVSRKFAEEVGAMNIFFAFDEGDHVEIATPPLSGTILPGITRASILQLAPTLNPKWKVVERPVGVEEILSRIEDGSCLEAFGAGTAAVVSPIDSFVFHDKDYDLKESHPIGEELRDTMYGIQYGKIPDRFGWIQSIDD